MLRFSSASLSVSARNAVPLEAGLAAHAAPAMEGLVNVLDLRHHLLREREQHPHVAPAILQNLLRLFACVRMAFVDAADHRFFRFCRRRVEDAVVVAGVDQAGADVLAALGDLVVGKVAALDPEIKNVLRETPAGRQGEAQFGARAVNNVQCVRAEGQRIFRALTGVVEPDGPGNSRPRFRSGHTDGRDSPAWDWDEFGVPDPDFTEPCVERVEHITALTPSSSSGNSRRLTTSWLGLSMM